MKKIIAIIIILIIIVLGFLGFNFITKNNLSNNSSNQSVTADANKSSSKIDNSKTSDTAKNTNEENNTKNLNSENNINSVQSSNKENNVQDTSNNKNNIPIKTLNSTKNSNNNSTNKINNNNLNESNTVNGYVPSSKLSNGPVTDTQLAEIMRTWLLKDQYSYSGFADCVGTMWAKQWLDIIPNSTLIDYFKQVNGANSLNSAITAKELFDASKAFTDAEIRKPIPFTTEQATQYITQMLKQCGYYSEVTKVVLHKYDKGPGLYYVYVKQTGDKNPYWYVNTNTGYATGA